MLLWNRKLQWFSVGFASQWKSWREQCEGTTVSKFGNTLLYILTEDLKLSSPLPSWPPWKLTRTQQVPNACGSDSPPGPPENQHPPLGAEGPACIPELGVDLQRFGQHLRPHVPHAIPTDVHFGQGGVATQGVDDDGDPSLEFRVSQGQGLQRLWRQQQTPLTRSHQSCRCSGGPAPWKTIRRDLPHKPKVETSG